MVLVPFATADSIKKTVHNRDSDAIPRHGHRTAGSPLIFDGIIFVYPVRIVTVTRAVVSPAHRIKSTLKTTLN